MCKQEAFERPEGYFYKGIFYPREDIERAEKNLLKKNKKETTFVLYIITTCPFPEIIEFLYEYGVLPKVHRENDIGWMLYPGFIAKDILEKLGC